MQMKLPVSAFVLALAGCAAAPVGEDNQTIEQFVSTLSGKELRLRSSTSDAVPESSASSGAKDAAFGYAGLKQVYAPAYRHCESARGILRIVEQRAFSKGGRSLPARFQCSTGDKVLWELDVRYTEKSMAAERSGRIIALTPQANLLTASEIANRRASQDAAPKSEQRLQEKEKSKTRAEPAEKPVTEHARKTAKSEELKLFRKNLKAGDRVQWKTAAGSARGVGQVIRLDGDLALIQFDSPAHAGQSLRYFNRSQLEPFGGLMPIRVAR
ncbi:MAG: hypothetical protein ACO1NO_09595 [Burkholderiaceae bacterium]